MTMMTRMTRSCCLPAPSLSYWESMIGGISGGQTGWLILCARFCNASYDRRKVRVSKFVVHENFTSNFNDIALLKLGNQDYTK